MSSTSTKEPTFTEQMFNQGNKCPYKNIYQGIQPRILAVCTAGLLRSPTIATIGSQLGYNTRSAGAVDYYALIPVNPNMIRWADYIVFADEKCQYELLQKFSQDRELLQLIKDRGIVWDIPDNYEYMEEMLVYKVKEKYSELFG